MVKALPPILPVTKKMPAELCNPNLACNQQPDTFLPIQPTEYNAAKWFERHVVATELCAQCPLLQSCMYDTLERDLPYVQTYERRAGATGANASTARPEFNSALLDTQYRTIRAGLSQIERQRLLEAITERKPVFPKDMARPIKDAARLAMVRLNLIDIA